MASVSPEDLQTHRSFGDMDIPLAGTSSRPIDIPPSTSYRLPGNWESVDFNQSPGFAYTPSYVGSFGSNHDGSPALNNWGERESTAVNHSHNPSGDLFDDVKYQPEAYGEPATSQGTSPYMLMDNQSTGAFNHMGAAGGDNLYSRPRSDSNGFTYDSVADQFSPRHGEIYNASSPVSNVDNRSRASSVSSYHDAHTSPYMPSSEYNASVNERFDQLNFDSPQDPYRQRRSSTGGPSFSNSPALPSVEFNIASQDQQATSPPALMIPNDSNNTLRVDDAPTLDSMGNVAINFVPATPVSAGGAGGGANGSFQKILAELSRNRQPRSALYERGNSTDNGVLPSISSFNSTALEASGLGDSAGASPRAHPMSWGSILSASGQSQGTAPAGALPQQAASRVYHHGYNVPANPNYGTQSSLYQQQHDSPHSPPTPDMSITMQQQISPEHQRLPPFAQHTQSDSVLTSSRQLLGSYTPNSDITTNSDSAFNLTALHDDMSFLSAPITPSKRIRSQSDASSRNPPQWSLTPPGAEAGSSSQQQQQRPSSASGSSYDPYAFPTGMAQHQEPQRPLIGHVYDTSPGPTLDQSLSVHADFATSLKRANSDGGRSGSHRRGAKSEDLSMLRGLSPGIGGMGEADFVRSVTMADGSLAPIDPRAGVVGPQRRRGSGGGHERNSSLGSLRSTPYSLSARPSPLSSPGASPQHSPSGGTVEALPVPLHDPQQNQQRQQPSPLDIKVERALVTTPATKTASANRRRAEANFVCPVPNCGSTFTRHFNLRGHMRSHNEERPFKCKWPGCEKGFARQHDCKRHEALHLNIRPYTCEGCQKTFARMDALNRHLRSEGGGECQKVAQNTDDLHGMNDENQLGRDMEPKVEENSSIWISSSIVM
ncbi:hypothetical protein FRB97_000820 [Tulasnella sp. 331]|nr:hypothetical protein FRB97_000820 [Tulasnella sp. 331]